MPPILGNAIVILALLGLVYVCGKNVLGDIRGQLKGKGCSSCGGGCSSCSGSCASCSGCAAHKGAVK